MKKNTTPDTVPPVPAVPVIDQKTAFPVKPRRHEPSGRTIGFHQKAGETGVHLFSPTGNFIDTVPAGEVAKFEPQPEAAPAAESRQSEPVAS